ncbi:MAG: hypothetical protein ACOYL3_06830 [Desulfuromonadaceae bacterium]
MPFLTEHKQKFDDLRAALHEGNRTQLKRSANGGNTVLFVYPPAEEEEYIAKAKELYPDGHFIDIAELFVKSIDSVGIEDFKQFYKDHITTTDVVFTNDDPNSLFSLIVSDICQASQDGKTTFLIHTGALEGTGIENVNIMEHKAVMAQGIPLVIFYPSTYKNDELLFLNHKSASKYRCNLVK